MTRFRGKRARAERGSPRVLLIPSSDTVSAHAAAARQVKPSAQCRSNLQPEVVSGLAGWVRRLRTGFDLRLEVLFELTEPVGCVRVEVSAEAGNDGREP